MGDRVATKLYILTERKQESVKAEIVATSVFFSAYSVFFSNGVVSFDFTLCDPHTLKLTPQNWTLISIGKLVSDPIIMLRITWQL